MKKAIIKWSFRVLLFAVTLLGLLVIIVLNPSLMYANKKILGDFNVYHDNPIDKDCKLRLDDAMNILQTSELYDSTIKFDICLNDGSHFPELLEIFLGRAFALGYTSNKVTLCGKTNFQENYVEVNGLKWNLTQLLAHEETHCLVFHKLGFWNSNPVANHPKWKWEGYPEYVARQQPYQLVLAKNIEQLIEGEKKEKDEWGISFADSTITSREYFKYRLLNQYCFEIRKMSFNDLLNDTSSEQTIEKQMMDWYDMQKLTE